MRYFLTSFAVMALLIILPFSGANAQSLADGLSGFSQSSDEPIEIESDTLDVFDEDKTAIFSGNVTVRQGQSTLKASELKVFYEGETVAASTASPADTANTQNAQRLRRLEASGKVLVTAEDQSATSDRATFDVASDTITMFGNVVLTQGGNVVRGDRLVVDLKTRQSRMESKSSGQKGRVQGLFLPGSAPQTQ